MKIRKLFSVTSITIISSVTIMLFSRTPVMALRFSTPSPNFQMAFIDHSGNVYLKSNSINAPYIQIWNSGDPARAVYLSQRGIAVLDISGNLFLNRLPIVSNWTKIATSVWPGSFAVSNNGVNWLTNQTLYYKPLNQLTAQWSPVMSNVSDFQLAQNGNVVANLNGTLYEAYGGYGAQWTAVATNFGSYSVSNTQLAAVFNSSLYIKNGVWGKWYPALTGARNVQISPNGNIGAVDINGNLDVTTNGYGSSWTANIRQNGDFESWYISDSLIAVVHDYTLFVKTGGTTAMWLQLASNVTSFSVD